MKHVLALLALVIAPFFASATPHDGPDPIGSWRLGEKFVKDGKLVSLLGVDGRVTGKLEFVKGPSGSSLWFDGKTTRVVLADDFKQSKPKLPKRHLTVEAWVAINTKAADARFDPRRRYLPAATSAASGRPQCAISSRIRV